MWIICFIVFVFFIGYSPLVVRRYHMISSKVNHLKIILISDLHGSFYGKKQEKLICKIKRENPDVILFAGDMIDEKHDIKSFELLLEGLDGYLCYFIFGNHEMRTHRYREILDLLKKYSVHLLKETYQEKRINDSHIIFSGIDDCHAFVAVEDYQKTLGYLDNCLDYDRFSILLSHRPYFIEDYVKTHFDLIVCGHSHGGQWRIPFILNGVYAPYEKFFPKYAGGKYELDGSTMIVSRGMAKNMIPRFFNPPELVVIHINE